MKNKDIVKSYVLQRKIEEYFAKNPKSKSVIVSYDSQDGRTSWKVKKENSSFHITEVVATKNKFIIEAGTNPFIKTYGDEKTSTRGDKPFTVDAKPEITPTLMTYDDDQAKVPDPEAKARGQKAFDDMQKYQDWMPKGGQNKFASTLVRTRDLSQTLNTMFDELTKSYGDEAAAVGVFNSYFDDPVAKIASKQDLMNVTKRKAIADTIKMQNPNMKQDFFKEGKSFFVEMPALGAPPPPGGGQPPQGKPALPSASVKSAQSANIQAFNQVEFSEKLSMIQSGAVPLNEPVLSGVFLELMKPDAFRNVVQLRKIIESVASRVDPINKGIAGAFMGVLTVLSNHKSVVSADNRKDGNIVKEEEELDPQLPQDSSKKKVDNSEDDVGIEDDGSEEDASPIQEKQKTEEEFIVKKRLTGQTIKDASIDIDSNGGKLTLTLVNTNIPAEIKWTNSGKVVFDFKGRKYHIRRGKH
jgi:hypothetical protein